MPSTEGGEGDAQDQDCSAGRRWIRDDGVGLPPGFEPESHATLGLRLVSTLAKQVGGQLTVKSSVGAGATFSVAFPVPANTLHEGEA